MNRQEFAPRPRPAARPPTARRVVLLIVLAGVLGLCGYALYMLAHKFDKAYVAAMKSDLRNLAAAQDTYFAQHNAYALASAEGLVDTAGVKIWKPSYGVHVVPGGTAASSTGWSAQVTRGGVDVTCAMHGGAGVNSPFEGSEAPPGEPECR
jgi:hypothetical protein